MRSAMRLFPDKMVNDDIRFRLTSQFLQYFSFKWMVNDDLRFCRFLLISSRTHHNQILLRRRQEIRSAIWLFPYQMVNDDLRFCLLLLVSPRTHHNQILLRRRQEIRSSSRLFPDQRLMTTFSFVSSSQFLPGLTRARQC